jgi:hypothetical protein
MFWCILAFFTGIGLTFVQWGERGGFHGVGVPVAQVYWEDGKDYPNPYAIFMNPALCIVLVIVIYFILKPLICRAESTRKRNDGGWV